MTNAELWSINTMSGDKTRSKGSKIELELIMSDVAIRYLGALIFFVNLENVMVTICKAGTFYLSTNL